MVLLALLGLFFIQNGFSDSKEDRIRELLTLTNAKESAQQILETLLAQIKTHATGTPDGYWEKFREVMDYDKFINLIVPIYEKYFTEEDIGKMIEFYQSEVGKKYLSLKPAITADALQVGIQWGQELAATIINKLKNDGYLNS